MVRVKGFDAAFVKLLWPLVVGTVLTDYSSVPLVTWSEMWLEILIFFYTDLGPCTTRY